MRNRPSHHVSAHDLALFSAGDLPFWQRVRPVLHLRGCVECRVLVDHFRECRQDLRVSADRLPAEVEAEWNDLAAEMTANIRLGLEAGECVAPFAETPAAADSRRWQWRPALVGATVACSLVMAMGAAWWLNIPTSDLASLRGAFARVAGGRFVADTTGPLVQASSKGIEFRDIGGSMGMNREGAEPVTRSVSFEGSASAHYVDDDTGQVTVNTVYLP